MNELQNLPLLDAKTEIALAREIEELEIAHWRALLSNASAVDLIATAVAAELKAPVPSKLQALLKAQHSKAGRTAARSTPGARLISAAATQLREVDTTRQALHAADRTVRYAFATDGRAQRYLERVAQTREVEQAAKGRFATANLRLVISMARRYDRSLLPLSDLIQEGNLGLIRAVERYDYKRGYRFSTYASWWIRHALNRALSDKGRLVRVPVHALDDLARVARATRTIASKTGVTPSTEALAAELDMSVEKLETLKTEGLVTHPVSLDRPLGSEGDQTLHDILQGPEQADPAHAVDLARWSGQLEHLLATLPRIEAAILRYRFGLEDGEELTLREIGQKYNLSRERIRQLQAEALTKLRDACRKTLRPGDTRSGVAA